MPQQWLNLPNPAIEETLYDTLMFRKCVGPYMGEEQLPNKNTILRFRHLLEAHELSVQILANVNATLTPTQCKQHQKQRRNEKVEASRYLELTHEKQQSGLTSVQK